METITPKELMDKLEAAERELSRMIGEALVESFPDADLNLETIRGYSADEMLGMERGFVDGNSGKMHLFVMNSNPEAENFLVELDEEARRQVIDAEGKE